MAVNKNFVVKNGLEVNETLILANATNNQVGIGTSLPAYTLHVTGGIGVTEAYISGITTIGGDFSVAGVSTIASAGGITTTGGDLYVGGYLYVRDDISYDEVTGRNLNITGVATFNQATSTNLIVTGITTLSGTNKAVGISTGLVVVGVTTLASQGGITTTGGDLWVGNNLNVKGDIVYDEVTGRNLNITGVGTIASADINAGDISISALNVTGLSTQVRISNSDFVGTSATITRFNATDVVGTSATFTTINATTISATAQIGVASEGTFMGAGASMINFASSNGTAWTVVPAGTSGIATVTVTPGASIGLAIALGG